MKFSLMNATAGGRRASLHAGLLVLGLAAGAFSAAAQQSPPTVTIVLPQRLLAAQPATLAVLGLDGRLLPGAELEFSGGVQLTTDSTGRATFRAPRDPGVLIVRLAGKSVSASATVVPPPAAMPDGVQVQRLPRTALIDQTFDVVGSGFRGEADLNQVMLGDKPALVLAASPVALVVLPGPGCMPGLTQFVVQVEGRSPGPLPLRLVSMELLLDKGRLAAGERAKLRIRVRGTEERLEIEARNQAPEIVRLVDGDVQRVTTRGGTDNTATLNVEGVRPGDYSVRLRLIRSVSGLPDTEACREHLLAARAIAPEEWFPRVDRLISLIEESPQNSLRVRTELEKMLAQMPPGEFGRLLEAAWRALL